ncbi:unnamed protein product [Urochloa decumbens]|uniref:Zinc beta-ribbon domain-containing protein n=1 Tax=Urochloa decumbens TaxID=240449 RepID=A0ABC9GIH8_9POAL
MEHPAGSNNTAVPTSYALAVPAHAPKPSSCHVPAAPIHLEGERKAIVLALPAPDNPNPGPFRFARQRRTFWTACTSCKELKKYPIEYLNCNISCSHCSEAFKALEVTKPRNKSAATTLSETRREHGNSAPTSASIKSPKCTPLRKKLKTGVSAIQSAMHDIKMLMMFKGKAVVIEKIKETMRPKNNSEYLPEPTQDGGHQAEA